MRAHEETLPAAFSLLRSEFNPFLFASIGEEENHNALTVLSALSRQGIDPWQQAARLSRLPRDTATQKLAAIIEALPNGLWPKSDAADIAARLVSLLPHRASAPARSAEAALARHPLVPRIAKSLVYAGLIAAAFFLATRQGQPSAPDAAPPSLSSSAVPSALAQSFNTRSALR